MTQDTLATRSQVHEIGGHVVDVYGHSFGKIVAIHGLSDEVVIKTNRGVHLTISSVDIYYNGGGEYILVHDIELDDAVTPEVTTPALTGIDATLAERGSKYGPFDTHAAITQAIKAAMYGAVLSDGRHIETNWEQLSFSQAEALQMIAHKIGRILNGDPNYADSWVDIAGYAQLVVNELEGK